MSRSLNSNKKPNCTPSVCCHSAGIRGFALAFLLRRGFAEHITQYAQINSSYGIAFSESERVNKAPMQNILVLQNVQNHFSIGLHAWKPVSVHGLAIRVNIIKAHDSRGELSSRANTRTALWIYPLFRRAETPRRFN